MALAHIARSYACEAAFASDARVESTFKTAAQLRHMSIRLGDLKAEGCHKLHEWQTMDVEVAFHRC